jgi:hypothetical protein
MHTLGPTRQDDGGGLAALYLIGGDAMRNDLREHSYLANSPGNQLRVLGTEIHHENRRTNVRCHNPTVVAFTTTASLA